MSRIDRRTLLGLGLAASTMIASRRLVGASAGAAPNPTSAFVPPQMDEDSREFMAAQLRPSATGLSPDVLREQRRRDRLRTQPDLPQVDRVREYEMPGPHGPIALRVYRGAGTADLPVLPVHIYYHGGGWIIGDLDSHDWTCRSIANAAQCAVVNVDYHLAPEYPFPIAFDDALAAVRWVVANAGLLRIDPARVSIGGDSAGGNLAAAVALALRDGGVTKLRAQSLLYPVLDLTMSGSYYGRFTQGVILTDDGLRASIAKYVPNPEQRQDWRASPLLAPSLRGLPPTLLILPGIDPLCAEGEAYAARLEREGVGTTVKRYAGQMHGFVAHAKVLRKAYDAISVVAQLLLANH